jgi:hypothetical protein
VPGGRKKRYLPALIVADPRLSHLCLSFTCAEICDHCSHGHEHKDGAESARILARPCGVLHTRERAGGLYSAAGGDRPSRKFVGLRKPARSRRDSRGALV